MPRRDDGLLTPLRDVGFRLYFLSRAVNLVGGTMASIALAFAVLDVDDSPQALGVVLAAGTVPSVLFILLGGVVADRIGRSLVIQGGNLVAGASRLLMAGLVLSGHATVASLAVLGAVSGTASAISLPALAGIVPALVPREHLQPANVLLGLTRSSLAIAGPTVGGVLVVTVGPGWALGVDGVTYLVAAALLVPVRIPPRARTAEEPTLVAELREGWVYFRGTAWLWAVVVGFGAMNAIEAGAFNTLGPVLAKASAIGEHGWGLILSGEAVGALVMGLVLSRVRLNRPLLWGMVGMLGYGLPIVTLGLVAQTAPVAIASFVAGLGVEVFSIGWSLAMQENVPDDMLSRANSYDMLGSFVAIPLGQLLFGPLGAVFGLQRTILAAGVVYVVVVALVLASRSVRDLPRAPAVELTT